MKTLPNASPTSKKALLANLIGNICILGNASLNPVEEILVPTINYSGVGQDMSCNTRYITYEEEAFYLFVQMS